MAERRASKRGGCLCGNLDGLRHLEKFGRSWGAANLSFFERGMMKMFDVRKL